MKDTEPTLPPGIPPMPSKWERTVEEWIQYQQESNQSVKNYFRMISQLNRPIELDKHGQPVITVSINPKSGMMEETEPSLAQELFSDAKE